MEISINSIENREQVINLVIAKLRENGVKYRKEPASKPNKKDKFDNYDKNGKIFYIPLQYLDSTEVVINGIGAVKVPTFVVNSCRRILEEVSTLGIFRKTGSANRQKEIIIRLERGLQYEESDNVIDIACILKTFFRSLPDPLIPPGNLQETLIRCLLNDATAKSCVLLACLLLPPLVLNTLAYFCQFLAHVGRYADTNKMTISNLSIILAPNIMPVQHNIQQRHVSHVRIVQIMIENANELGVVPEVILDQLQKLNVNEAALLYTIKKKKKRRSGSLTRMFNGFKKIVGALGSSNESLEQIPSTNPSAGSNPATTSTEDIVTPCLTKSAKKRRVNRENPFSARKKKELLSFLPEGSDILPNTPAVVKEKKRISLGLNRKHVATTEQKQPLQASESVPTAMDRRWSLVGGPWPRNNNKKSNEKESGSMHHHQHARLSPVVSLPSLSTPDRCSFIKEETCIELAKAKSEDIYLATTPVEEIPSTSNCDPEIQETSFVNVPRSEYEDIKKRVSAIETKITEEFEKQQTTDTKEEDSFVEPVIANAETVEEKFQKTLDETNPVLSVASTTDQLAKRLSRELKIRRSTECRSPSARKIGTIRRRSRERLSRSTTWHMGSTTSSSSNSAATETNQTISEKIDHMSKESLCLRSNLKRGRPNTVLTGLRYPSPIRKGADETHINKSDDEKWMEADKFFNEMDAFKTPKARSTTAKSCDRAGGNGGGGSITPKYVTSISVNDKNCTPMAPPPSLPPRRTPARKTPNLPPKTPAQLAFAHAALPAEAQSGRASIARIRSQNAGHVAAKARLFDNLAENGSAKTSTNVSGPKNYKNQHSVPTIKGEERLLNRVLKESNKVPRLVVTQHTISSSPRHLTTPRRVSCVAMKRQKLKMSNSPISKRSRKSKMLVNDDLIRRKRISELTSGGITLNGGIGGGGSGSASSRTTNENRSPAVRKSPRLHMRR